MHHAYKMVLVSGIALLIVCVGFIIYRYIYPKKKVNFFVLLVAFAILPTISIFRLGDYESGDFNIHVYRAIEYYALLQQGNLMPSWAGDLNATYGYPLYIFLNPLPYYLQSLFHFLGASFINSMKLLLALSYITSGIFFYLWAKKEFRNTFAAFSGAIIYLFTPYHLVDLHFRNAIGEVMVFALLPFFFYAFARFREGKTLQWFLISSFAFALMIFSHQAVAVFSLFIFIPYALFYALKERKNVQFLLYSLCIIILGLVFSSSVWFAHVIYPQYTLAHLLTGGAVEFPTVDELLFSPWRYGLLFQGPTGQISFLIGYTQLIILIAGIIVLFTKRNSLKQVAPLLFWMSLSLFLLFMMTPFSWLIWRIAPILNTAQFSMRLLLDLTFCLGALMAFFTLFLKKFPLVISAFLLLSIGYTILNWGHRTVLPEITDKELIANLSKSTSQGEGFCCMAQPKWLWPDRRWEATIPKNHVAILQGRGEIKQISRTNISHLYVTSSKDSLLIKEYTWFFPGWNLFIDDKPTELTYTKGENPGLIQFSVPSGLHKVELLYKDLPDLIMAKIVTVVTITSTLLLLLILFFKKKFRDSINNRFYLDSIHSNKKRQR